jgi:hypothetical protein
MNLTDFRLRVRALFPPAKVERELDDELAFDIECETRKLMAGGLPAAEARRRALARFGPVPLAEDRCRDERGISFFETLARDVGYALRTSPSPSSTRSCSRSTRYGIRTSALPIARANHLGDPLRVVLRAHGGGDCETNDAHQQGFAGEELRLPYEETLTKPAMNQSQTATATEITAEARASELSSRTAFGKRNRITQMVTASVAIGRAPSMRRRVRHRNTPIRFRGARTRSAASPTPSAAVQCGSG